MTKKKTDKEIVWDKLKYIPPFDDPAKWSYYCPYIPITITNSKSFIPTVNKDERLDSKSNK